MEHRSILRLTASLLAACLCITTTTASDGESSFGNSLSQLITNIGPNMVTDLVILMDRSQGMGRNYFYLQEKAIVSALLRQYAVLHPDYTRLAIITFAKTTEVSFDFIRSDTNQNTKGNIFYSEEPPIDFLRFYTQTSEVAGTDLLSAFTEAQSILAGGKLARPTRRGVILVISDGAYDDDEDPHAVVSSLKADDITIYGFGLGAWLRRGNVRELATSHEYYGEYNDYVTLLNTIPRSWQSDTLPIWYTANDYLCGGTACVNGACFNDALTGNSMCRCAPGYTLSNSGVCEQCPYHTYKSKYGNEACSPCPTGFVALLGKTARTDCECGQFTPNCDPNDVNLDACQNHACNSHQSCLNYGQTSTCECIEGFDGITCADNPDNCPMNACQNGGTCLDGVDDYSCACPLGYMGQHCEIDIDDCGPPVCDNGANCTDGYIGFYCTCAAGFTGSYCQNVIPPTTLPPPTTPAPERNETDNGGGDGGDNNNNNNGTLPSSGEQKTGGLSETLIIIIGACAGGVLLLVVVICIVVTAVMNKRRKDAVNEATLAKAELAKRSSARRYRKTITKTLSQAFAGFWKRRTLRGSMYADGEAEVSEGMPSAPPKKRPDILGTEAVRVVDEMVLDEQMSSPYVNSSYVNYKPDKQGGKISKGMEGWHSYLRDLKTGDIISCGAISDVDSDKHATTANFSFYQKEIEALHDALLNCKGDITLNIQGLDFYIFENDGTMAHGNSTSSEGTPEVVYLGRTKRFLVVLLALDDGAHSPHVKKELEWILDHINGEGY